MSMMLKAQNSGRHGGQSSVFVASYVLRLLGI